MRRSLRLLGFTLTASFILVMLATVAALATEPGFLPLKALVGPITMTGLGTLVTRIGGAAGQISCLQVHLENGALGSSGQTHVNLGTARLSFLKCTLEKEKSKIACRSENTKGEKDPIETILVTVDLHLLDVLTAANVLEPGIAVIPLEPAGTVGTLKVLCGVGLVEVRGFPKGLVLVSSLTEEVTSGTLDFLTTGEKCDLSDELCKLYEKEDPFEVKFGKAFEAGSEEATIPFSLSEMVLVDD